MERVLTVRTDREDIHGADVTESAALLIGRGVRLTAIENWFEVRLAVVNLLLVGLARGELEEAYAGVVREHETRPEFVVRAREGDRVADGECLAPAILGLAGAEGYRGSEDGVPKLLLTTERVDKALGYRLRKADPIPSTASRRNRDGIRRGRSRTRGYDAGDPVSFCSGNDEVFDSGGPTDLGMKRALDKAKRRGPVRFYADGSIEITRLDPVGANSLWRPIWMRVRRVQDWEVKVPQPNVRVIPLVVRVVVVLAEAMAVKLGRNVDEFYPAVFEIIDHQLQNIVGPRDGIVEVGPQPVGHLWWSEIDALRHGRGLIDDEGGKADIIAVVGAQIEEVGIPENIELEIGVGGDFRPPQDIANCADFVIMQPLIGARRVHVVDIAIRPIHVLCTGGGRVRIRLVVASAEVGQI